MPRILLVNLPISVNSPRTAFPPLALLVLGGALKALRESGLEFEYELLDLDLRLKQGRLRDDAGFFAQGAEWVSARRPDLCFFSTHGINQQLILPLAEALKALRPTCRMVLGGVGATLQAAELIRNFPQLDLVIKGEGEPALPALVAALLEGRDFSAVPGAVYRQGGGCVENPRPPALAAEEIPTPDYTLLQLEEYAAHNRKHPYIVPGFGLIESGRGCGWNCAFCAPAKMWNRRARYRPIPALVREMRLLAGHGLGFSFFTQDNLDPSFLREFSAALVEEQVGLPWGCYARLHALTDADTQLMAEAGCRLIFVGLETSNRGAQKFIRKVLDQSEVLGRIERINALGIRLIASFIAGFPGESEAELERTLWFALESSAGIALDRLRERVREAKPEGLSESRANFCMVHPLCYMPGTDLHEAARERLRFTEHSLHHDSYGSYLFGMNEFQRQHWRSIFSPFVTHLSEDQVRFYYSTLRLFNFLNGRPYYLARMVEDRGRGPLALTRELVARLGEEFVLRGGTAEFEAQAGGLVRERLGASREWSAERVLQEPVLLSR